MYAILPTIDELIEKGAPLDATPLVRSRTRTRRCTRVGPDPIR